MARQRSLGCVAICVGGLVVLSGLCLILGFVQIRESKENIAKADQYAADGDTAHAVEIYKQEFEFVDTNRQVDILRTIAEYEVDLGNEKEARRWMNKALDGELEIDFQSQAARRLIEEIRNEREEIREKLEREL